MMDVVRVDIGMWFAHENCRLLCMNFMQKFFFFSFETFLTPPRDILIYYLHIPRMYLLQYIVCTYSKYSILSSKNLPLGSWLKL